MPMRPGAVQLRLERICSFYVEMVKSRLQDPAARPVAQRVLASTLDNLLRLLHPFIPFITRKCGSGWGKRPRSAG